MTALVWLNDQGRRWRRWPTGLTGKLLLPVTVGGFLLLISLGRDVQALIDPVRNRLPDVASGATWLAEHTSADAVVLAETPRVSCIYARRSMVPYPDATYEARVVFGDRDACASISCIAQVIQQYGIDYVLVTYRISPDLPLHWSSFTKEHIMPLMESDPERFQAVYTSSDGLVRVYQVRPASTSP
jgi:hypothetical protein